jgi:hypothetical protein
MDKYQQAATMVDTKVRNRKDLNSYKILILQCNVLGLNNMLWELAILLLSDLHKRGGLFYRTLVRTEANKVIKYLSL